MINLKSAPPLLAPHHATFIMKKQFFFPPFGFLATPAYPRTSVTLPAQKYPILLCIVLAPRWVGDCFWQKAIKIFTTNWFWQFVLVPILVQCNRIGTFDSGPPRCERQREEAAGKRGLVPAVTNPTTNVSKNDQACSEFLCLEFLNAVGLVGLVPNQTNMLDKG